MKTCRLCCSANNGFYNNRNVCKRCISDRYLKWQKDNKERKKEYNRKYSTEVYEPANRHKRKARNKLIWAVIGGKVKRQDCWCGKYGEAHHYLGYDIEHALDVKWLCKKHHAQEEHANTYSE